MLSRSIINHRLILKLRSNRCCSKLAYVHRPDSRPLIYENLGQQIARAAEKYGAQIAIKSSYEKKQLSFEDSYRQAVNLALKLQELGLRQGEHLAVWAPNTLQWYITFLASAVGGFPLVCINPALEIPELGLALEKARVKCLITMESYGKMDFQSKIAGLAEAGHIKQHLLPVVIKSERKMDEFVNYDDMLKKKCDEENLHDVISNVPLIAPESPCSIQFTSGTTGQPKAALLSHYNVVNEAAYMGRALKLHRGENILCLTVPMFHAYGFNILASCLYYGSTVCLPSPTFNASAALECVERDKCTIVVGTPTMFVDLLDTQSRLKKSIETLNTAVMGGASCTAELLTRTKNVFQLSDMIVCYGMTEATAAVFARDGSEAPESALNSVGNLFGHLEAKIVDDAGRTLQFGEVGELCVRGWCTMMGYFGDEENTRQSKDANGWLKTGDLFLLESNGVAHYQGRKKDVIIRGGENVFPREIEEFLNSHESVLESHVVGVPDSRLGEEICAYMRLKPGAKPLTEADVRKFCGGRLAYFKVPKYVRVVEGFSKTATGKIQKSQLRELFKLEGNGKVLCPMRNQT